MASSKRAKSIAALLVSAGLVALTPYFVTSVSGEPVKSLTRTTRKSFSAHTEHIKAGSGSFVETRTIDSLVTIVEE